MKKILLLVLIFNFIFLNSAFSYCVNVDFFNRFNDTYLEKYIELALLNNHELKQANYKVEQYRNEIKTQFSKELPELSVSSNYLGAHFPKNDYNFFLRQNSYILPLRASYEPDLLLKNRDKTKLQKKIYYSKLANQKGVYISLLTDVASAYVNILLMDYLINNQKKIIQNQLLKTTYETQKFKFGIINQTDLNETIEKLKNEEMIFEGLEKNLKTTLYNFSVLIGESPENFSEIKRGKIETFDYQKEFPKEINSNIIWQRPDIEEIENELKASKIDITIAKKEFFPNFNITGFLVFDTAGGGNFFSWNSSFAYLLAGLTQDVFKGGYKIANLKIKKARFQELVEKYKQTDLIAIKEINNALNIIDKDTINQNLSKEKLELEKNNLKNASKRLQKGTISKYDFLENKITLKEKERIFISAKAMRLIDYFTLYKAVGGAI